MHCKHLNRILDHYRKTKDQIGEQPISGEYCFQSPRRIYLAERVSILYRNAGKP